MWIAGTYSGSSTPTVQRSTRSSPSFSRKSSCVTAPAPPAARSPAATIASVALITSSSSSLARFRARPRTILCRTGARVAGGSDGAPRPGGAPRTGVRRGRALPNPGSPSPRRATPCAPSAIPGFPRESGHAPRVCARSCDRLGGARPPGTGLAPFSPRRSLDGGERPCDRGAIGRRSREREVDSSGGALLRAGLGGAGARDPGLRRDREREGCRARAPGRGPGVCEPGLRRNRRAVLDPDPRALCGRAWLGSAGHDEPRQRTGDAAQRRERRNGRSTVTPALHPDRRPSMTPGNSQAARLAAALTVGLALLPCPGAAAPPILGADLGGADLVVAHGDVLSGTFTNVGTFAIPSGVSVSVAPGVPLSIQAHRIDIEGTLDGRSAGQLGGAGRPGRNCTGNQPGLDGSGPGAGKGGKFGSCVSSTGGAGGGYGGNGGQSQFYSLESPGSSVAGGPAYGDVGSASIAMGSGGGGGAAWGPSSLPGASGPGGRGGAAISLIGEIHLSATGRILADGTAGQPATYANSVGNGPAGGGGSGGGLLLDGRLFLDGHLSASGGAAGNVNPAVFGGGGGGAGGRIKLFGECLLGAAFQFDVSAGAGTNSAQLTNGHASSSGQAGSFHQGCTSLIDSDADGIYDVFDNCPEIGNADQADSDADYQGDACDADDDNDAVPDVTDNCDLVANPDQTDSDLDASGDVCDADDDNDAVADLGDNCPFTPNSSQSDQDHDGQGDACDGDPDGDLIE